MKKTRDEWKQVLEQELPSRESIVLRNRAITAHYAKLFLREPSLFKWAGMAAFASNQVGVALAFVELLETPRRMMGDDAADSSSRQGFMPLEMAAGALRMVFSLPFSLYDAAVRQVLLDDLQEIRQGNNAIYNDIAWAHEVYLRCGIGELEELTEESEKEYMLTGFRMIDEGRRSLSSDPRRAEELIREGNVLLLRHEQINTLRPVFEAISPPGRIVVSFGSELDFSGAIPPGHRDRASFAEHAGYFETLGGVKSVTDSRERWAWIEEQVLPVWRDVDRCSHDSPHLQEKMRQLASGETSMLQDIARFASTMSFLPGIPPAGEL
ncbi:MAG: hypothetical protein UMU76_04490 [Prosthecochloris sp.]|nr:hypothetical protein [Prosthecochloris sp.]